MGRMLFVSVINQLLAGCLVGIEDNFIIKRLLLHWQNIGSMAFLKTESGIEIEFDIGLFFVAYYLATAEIVPRTETKIGCSGLAFV